MLLSFIGDNFLFIPLAAAGLFMAVVGYVGIESAFDRH